MQTTSCWEPLEGSGCAGMEWTRELVLRLIDAYHSYPMLWDPTDPDYKNRREKYDAWKNISEELNVDRAEVIKKVEILTTQFRREVKKMKRKSDTRPDEVYQGNWFAFKSLAFLLDKMKPRSKTNAAAEVSQLVVNKLCLLYIRCVCSSAMNI